MEGRIVKVVTKGEATLVFHDDCCRNKTPAEIKAILDRIASIALPALKAAQRKKENEPVKTNSA